jgi:hypothetical protein
VTQLGEEQPARGTDNEADQESAQHSLYVRLGGEDCSTNNRVSRKAYPNAQDQTGSCAGEQSVGGFAQIRADVLSFHSFPPSVSKLCRTATHGLI